MHQKDLAGSRYVYIACGPLPSHHPLALLACTTHTYSTDLTFTCMYVWHPKTVYIQADGTELCSISTFSLLNRAIGVIGLGGLDRLLGFHIVHDLGEFLTYYKTSIREVTPFFEQLHDRLFPPWSMPADAAAAHKIYTNARTQVEKLLPPALYVIQRVGQAQLLRCQIAKELLFVCRTDANLYQLVSEEKGRDTHWLVGFSSSCSLASPWALILNMQYIQYTPTYRHWKPSI